MLAATGILGLFLRMLTSLALVLAIIAVAYAVMRRRSTATRTGPARAPRTARLPRAASRRPGRAAPATAAPRRRARRSGRSQVEVLGRVGLTRSTAAVALRFGDRVVLVGASEQAQPTVLAELDLATWELYDQDAEWRVPDTDALVPANGVQDRGVVGGGADRDEEDIAPARRPMGFLDALREATVRRG